MEKKYFAYYTTFCVHMTKIWNFARIVCVLTEERSNCKSTEDRLHTPYTNAHLVTKEPPTMYQTCICPYIFERCWNAVRAWLIFVIPELLHDSFGPDEKIICKQGLLVIRIKKLLLT